MQNETWRLKHTHTGMLRQRLSVEDIKSSQKACKQFEELRVRNAQQLHEGRAPLPGGPPKQAPSTTRMGRESALVQQLEQLQSHAVVHLCYSPDLASLQTRAAIASIALPVAPAAVAATHTAVGEGGGGGRGGGDGLFGGGKGVAGGGGKGGSVGSSRHLTSRREEVTSASHHDAHPQHTAYAQQTHSSGREHTEDQVQQLSSPDWDDW